MKNTVKHFALAAVGFFLISGNTLFAQGMAADSMPKSKNWVTVGPFFTAGLDVFSGEVPEGLKTDMMFAYTGGVFGAFNFTPKFAIALALGYESRGLYFRDQATEADGESKTRLNYFTIQPSLKFSAFMIGVTINTPLSGTEVSNRTNPPAYSGITRDVSDSMKTLIDVRMGGMIPIMQNEKSDLNFMVQASYSLTSALPEGTDGRGQKIKFPLPTLQFGFCYTFELGK